MIKCVYKKHETRGRKADVHSLPRIIDIQLVRYCESEDHSLHYCKFHNIRGGCFHSGRHVCRCGRILG